ncbi:MAG: phosphatidate cytidylyltransferase [Chloroflexota bacterium]
MSNRPSSGPRTHRAGSGEPAPTQAPRRAPSGLLVRLASAAVGLPVVLGAVWQGGPALALLAGLAALAGGSEVLVLLARAGWRPLIVTGALWAGALAAAALFGGMWVLAALALGAVATGMTAFLVRRSPEAVGDGALTALGAAYAGLPLAAAVLTRGGPEGQAWVLVGLLATFATDTGAYAVGRLVGTHKMAPSISPSKTWEGAAGGLVATVAATVGLVALAGGIANAWVWAVGLGLAIGIAAQVGDLAESKLKRIAGVKDSGVLIPGHGGMLDRMDSLVVVLPLVYAASRLWPAG